VSIYSLQISKRINALLLLLLVVVVIVVVFVVVVLLLWLLLLLNVGPGKYRDNELTTVLAADKSTSGMFAMRTKKLRERIDSAVMEAQQAAQMALQKTGIATARYVRRSIY